MNDKEIIEEERLNEFVDQVIQTSLARAMLILRKKKRKRVQTSSTTAEVGFKDCRDKITFSLLFIYSLLRINCNVL